MNVDGVHVVDVVVHAAGDGQKLGHHREQQPHVVQLADDRPAPRARLGDGAHRGRRRATRPRRSPAGARTRPGSAAARAMASRANGSTRRALAHASLEEAHARAPDRPRARAVPAIVTCPSKRRTPPPRSDVRRPAPAALRPQPLEQRARARASPPGRARSSPASCARRRARGRRRSPWPPPGPPARRSRGGRILRPARACRRLRTRQRNSSAAAISLGLSRDASRRADGRTSRLRPVETSAAAAS